MKSLRARIAAILLVAAMGVSLTACKNNDADNSSVSGGNAEVSDNGDNSNAGENSAEADNSENADPDAPTEDPTAFLKQEITFGMAPGEEEETQDATEAPASTQAQAAQTNIVTQKVVVTEAGGAAVTEANGQQKTEIVTSVEEVAPTYVPAPKSEPIYWLDMTKSSDWVFNGDIMTIEFKIKEGTPDGNYPLMLTSPDFVNWDEEQLSVKTVGGYVTVGNATPTQADQVQPGQFTVSTTSAKGNAGDTVKISVNLSDNPGLVGMVVFFEYDSNALEVISSSAGEAISNLK